MDFMLCIEHEDHEGVKIIENYVFIYVMVKRSAGELVSCRHRTETGTV